MQDYAPQVDVRSVDPRDSGTEISSPTYRVFFWERLSGSSGFRSCEYEITGAEDVQEVLRWAEGKADGRTFTVYVVVNETLVRLSGQDPTAAT